MTVARPIAAVAIAAALAGPLAPVLAQQPGPAEPTAPPDKPWIIRFEPAVAFMAFSGDITAAGPGSAELSVETLNIDSATLGPYGELDVSRGRWRFSARGMGFSVDGGATIDTATTFGEVAISPGDTLTSELRYNVAGARGAYRVLDYRSGVEGDGVETLRVGVDAELGFRVHDLEFESTLTPLAAPPPGAILGTSTDAVFAELVGGAALELMYRETLGFDVFINGGGFSTGDRSSNSFDIGVSFVYQPLDWLGAQVGYRLLVFGFEEDGGPGRFEYDGSIAGLYWGLRLSF